MGTPKKKAAKPPHVQGPIHATDEAVETWISPSLEWPVEQLLAYIAHAEGGGAVAWTRHDATGEHTVSRPLHAEQRAALATLKGRLVHAETMRQGRKPGAYGVLRRVLEGYEATHAGAPFATLWDHLLALKDRRDETIEDVRDDNAGCEETLACHPGPHVHWIDDGGDTQTTSAKAVANLVGQIRKARRRA